MGRNQTLALTETVTTSLEFVLPVKSPKDNTDFRTYILHIVKCKKEHDEYIFL